MAATRSAIQKPAPRPVAASSGGTAVWGDAVLVEVIGLGLGVAVASAAQCAGMGGCVGGEVSCSKLSGTLVWWHGQSPATSWRSWVASCVGRCGCAVQQGEDGGNEDEGGDGGGGEAADDGAAERRVLFAAFAEAERHGDHADDHGEGGHHDGTEAGSSGFDGGEDGVVMLFIALLGEGDDEDGVGGGDAHAHDGAHERGHAEGGAGGEEEEDDAGECGGQRGDDDEGIEPGLEVDDDEEVDEDDGEGEAADEADVGAFMVSTWPRTWTKLPG